VERHEATTAWTYLVLSPNSAFLIIVLVELVYVEFELLASHTLLPLLLLQTLLLVDCLEGFLLKFLWKHIPTYNVCQLKL